MAKWLKLYATSPDPRHCTTLLNRCPGTPPRAGNPLTLFAAVRGSVRVRTRLVGRIGSGVRVIVAFMSVFNKNTGRVLSYGVLRHEKGGGL